MTTNAQPSGDDDLARRFASMRAARPDSGHLLERMPAIRSDVRRRRLAILTTTSAACVAAAVGVGAVVAHGLTDDGVPPPPAATTTAPAPSATPSRVPPAPAPIATDALTWSDGQAMEVDDVTTRALDGKTATQGAIVDGSDYEVAPAPPAGIALIGAADQDASRWTAQQVQADGSSRLGTWSTQDGFVPFPSTQSVAPSATPRTVVSVAVDPDEPARVAWAETEQSTAGQAGLWVFVVNPGGTTATLVTGPEAIADNTLTDPTVALLDSRVYWSQQSAQGAQAGRTVVLSAPADGGGSQFEAVDATDPVASSGGIFVTTLRSGSDRPREVARLTGSGVDPLVDLDEGVTDVTVRAGLYGLAVVADAVLYVVPTDVADAAEPVWVYRFTEADEAVVGMTPGGLVFWADTVEGGRRLFADAPGASNGIVSVPLAGDEDLGRAVLVAGSDATTLSRPDGTTARLLVWSYLARHAEGDVLD